MNPRVIAVEVIDNLRLLVTFDSQEKRIFDVSAYLELPAFEPLRNSPNFYNVRIAQGTVVWANNIDLCADTVYLKSVPI
jgi:hypothetical protein